MNLIVDSWAWIAVFESSAKAEQASSYLSGRGDNLFANVLTLYEVYYKLYDRKGKLFAAEAIASIERAASVIQIDKELSILAARVHLTEKLSALDAFAYATAIKLDGKVLTGDKDFKGKEKVLFIE